MRGTLHFVMLPVDIARIFRADFDLLDLHGLQHRIADVPAISQGHQCGVVHVRPAQQICQVVFALDGLAQHALGLPFRQIARTDPDRFKPLCFT